MSSSLVCKRRQLYSRRCGARKVAGAHLWHEIEATYIAVSLTDVGKPVVLTSAGIPDLEPSASDVSTLLAPRDAFEERCWEG